LLIPITVIRYLNAGLTERQVIRSLVFPAAKIKKSRGIGETRHL
jgi:hypothetical protein